MAIPNSKAAASCIGFEMDIEKVDALIDAVPEA
jgi:hypothetical protein